MDQLVDSGHSFSGNEAKCAFLNLGDNTFATVSAVSGFDFPDDGRALALTDWDRDGDLDAWMTCRTAPMLRYLRNDSPHANRSLLLKLEGNTGSRDAAGARAEVRLRGQPDKPIVRTVKLGEGYLGQNSRWLHFGLGSGAEIESIRVAWSGGKKEEIKDCRPDTFVAFTEGDLFPQIAPLKVTESPVQSAPLNPRRAELAGAVTLFQPALFPPLPSVDPNGTPWSVTDTAGPLLVNIFASWCPDCEKELTAWRDAAAQFKSAGITLTLLSADGRDTAHATGPAEAWAWAWLKKHSIPFPAGTLTEEAFRRLTTAHRNLFGAIVDLPVPTSFLLDGKGRVTAIYRGVVSAERILADAALAAKDDSPARTAAALPYKGRWLQVPDPPDPSFWLNDLAAQRAWEEAFAFFLRHTAILRLHKDFALMAASLGGSLAAAGKTQGAITAYEAGLTKTPDSPEILNNLAGLLANGPDKSLQNPPRALELADKANSLIGGNNPAFLDTLASAQAATGNFTSASATATKALSLARASTTQAALIPLLEKALAAYKTGRMPQ